MSVKRRRDIGLGLLMILGLVLAVGRFTPAPGRVLALGETPQTRALAGAIGTGFTYQGNLVDDGTPADGAYDFSFALYDGATGSGQVGATLTLDAIQVVEGAFTAALDFGNVFDGTPLWLDVAVRPAASADPYTTLDPRQPVTPVPYAVYSSGVPWAGVSDLPPGFADGIDDDTLGDLSCADGEIAKWGGAAWLCAPDEMGDGGIAAVTAGAGLTGGGAGGPVTLTVAFDGSGTADTVARSDHDHDDRYYTESELETSDASAVNWDNLVNVPSGFADGDDADTTYTAGDGLALSGTAFRLATVPRAGHVERLLDTIGITGRYPAIIIGLDGLPLISYYNATNGDLLVYHCDDMVCSSGTRTALDTTGIVGEFTSITIGRDGYGLISYYDRTNGDLKLARCVNVACTDATLTTVDSTGDVGQWTSITTSSDGYAFISYYDVTNADLKAVLCSNLTCSSKTIWTVDGGGDVGQYSSVVRTGRNYAYISYYDATNGDLKVARCVSLSCASPTTNTVDGTTISNGVEHDVGRWTSITAAVDGRPLIAYVKANQAGFHSGQVRVAHCTNLTCSAVTVENVISGAINWMGTSLTLTPQGTGLVSFVWDTASRVYVAQCTDLTCTDTVLNDRAVTTGSPRETSLTIGADGLPVLAYFSDAADELKFTHCSDLTCQPYLRRR
jgi:hypothetical protein